jgi:outer membrane receptor protein involved in Fe transport
MSQAQFHLPCGGPPKIAIAVAISFAVMSPALAGETTAPEMVIITARPPDPVGNTAFSTTLLDEQQLRISPELDTALRQVPALSLFRRNSSLSTNATGQGVSLRSIGASGAGRALVTLDGVPQNDPFGGWVIWTSLPTEDIQAAEIVRGAGAGPYGAGALTGVIALTERTGTSAVTDAEGGEIGEARVAGAGNVQFDNVSIGASAMYLTTGGWIPVGDSQRGAADVPLSLKATNAAIHGGVEIVPGTQVTGRFGFYDERRDTGILGAVSRAKGTTGSITVAHPEQPDGLGWRVQGWFRDTDMSNLTAGIGAKRASTTPAGNQYAVPALGWGANAALRGTFSWLDWEVGADARFIVGESRELFSFTGGQFRSSRFAGGRTFVGGLYAEGASRIEDWMITGGVRMDEWRNYRGHIIEHTLATGALTLNNLTADASGTVPTARAGLRREFGDGLFFRSAAYGGFRPPSLNELFRGFRVGNNFTLANSALKPERLYGVEAGIGDDDGALTWNVTGFWNKISDAVTLVTLASGPGTFPVAGFLPAGGQLIQRQNVGDIRAYGVEGDAKWALNDVLALRGAFNLTDAHVYGGSLAPQLTGKRPAQTPRWTVTAGIVATPREFVTLEAYLRYESLRWSDDLNTLPLGAVTTVDTRANFHVLPKLDLYAAVDNLFDAKVGTGRSADQVLSLEEPRTFRAGISYSY